MVEGQLGPATVPGHTVHKQLSPDWHQSHRATGASLMTARGEGTPPGEAETLLWKGGGETGVS